MLCSANFVSGISAGSATFLCLLELASVNELIACCFASFACWCHPCIFLLRVQFPCLAMNAMQNGCQTLVMSSPLTVNNKREQMPRAPQFSTVAAALSVLKAQMHSGGGDWKHFHISHFDNDVAEHGSSLASWKWSRQQFWKERGQPHPDTVSQMIPFIFILKIRLICCTCRLLHSRDNCSALAAKLSPPSDSSALQEFCTEGWSRKGSYITVLNFCKIRKAFFFS